MRVAVTQVDCSGLFLWLAGRKCSVYTITNVLVYIGVFSVFVCMYVCVFGMRLCLYNGCPIKDLFVYLSLMFTATNPAIS